MAFYKFCRRVPERRRRSCSSARCAQADSAATVDVGAHFTPKLQAVGPAPVPRPRRRSVRRARGGQRVVVTDRIETFTETGHPLAVGRRARRRRRRHRDRARAASSSAASGSRSTARRSSRRRRCVYKGMMCQRRAELRVRRRLHERVVDAQVRPDERVRVPPARTTWTSTATVACVPRRDPAVAEEPLLDFTSGYVQRSIDKFPRQGSIAAVEALSELRARPLDDPARAHRPPGARVHLRSTGRARSRMMSSTRSLI